MIKQTIFCLILLITTQTFGQNITVNDKWGRTVESCKKTKSDKNILILKQWHLLPSDNTKEFPDKIYPQKENLQSIYEQVSYWVEDAAIQAVFAEGCSGEIDEQFELKFNGWTFHDLKEKAKDEDYNKIICHVPLMIEAKYTDKIKTICGDDRKMIDDQNLKFSDLRAAIGFLTRLEKFEGNYEREKPYLEAIKKAYKLKRKLNGDGARDFLKTEIKKLISQIEKGIQKRNMSFLEAIEKAQFKNAAVIIGGIHARHLKTLIEKKKFNCQVVEFKGYEYDEEEMLRKINSYFK